MFSLPPSTAHSLPYAEDSCDSSLDGVYARAYLTLVEEVVAVRMVGKLT